MGPIPVHGSRMLPNIRMLCPRPFWWVFPPLSCDCCIFQARWLKLSEMTGCMPLCSVRFLLMFVCIYEGWSDHRSFTFVEKTSEEANWARNWSSAFYLDVKTSSFIHQTEFYACKPEFICLEIRSVSVFMTCFSCQMMWESWLVVLEAWWASFWAGNIINTSGWRKFGGANHWRESNIILWQVRPIFDCKVLRGGWGDGCSDVGQETCQACWQWCKACTFLK